MEKIAPYQFFSIAPAAVMENHYRCFRTTFFIIRFERFFKRAESSSRKKPLKRGR
jgi:hypothetical protein